MKRSTHNLAFIDGQNLYMGTQSDTPGWKIDLSKFRYYLQKKYSVEVAYYFLGFLDERNQDLYESIQRSGFVLVFKKHTDAMLGKKKGNVDTDIVFTIMKKWFFVNYCGYLIPIP
ncbi:MAG: NYN domain-containing protein [Candidatus Magasanikbacteria bacterium]|nr:NYN domain-containing protein [Candidatus Magasanikbacteria bacterium]